MVYVSVEGFAAFSQAASAISQDHLIDMQDILSDVEIRMLHFIIPNTPGTGSTRKAFCDAVYAQTVYEAESTNSQIAGMPAGMRSFSVNGFSASFDNAMSDGMSNIGLCKTARSYLALAGLLYRGVNCEC